MALPAMNIGSLPSAQSGTHSSMTSLASKMQGRKVSDWTKAKNWLKTHQKAIAISLIVIGVAIAAVGIGLIIAGATGGPLTTASYIASVSLKGIKVTKVIALSHAGKMILAGCSVVAGMGLIFAAAAIARSFKKNAE